MQAEGEGEGTKVAPPGFLSEIFGGQLSSRVACEVCHHTSITLEPFMDLSLPIPAGTLAGMTDAPDRYSCHPQKLLWVVQYHQEQWLCCSSACRLNSCNGETCKPMVFVFGIARSSLTLTVFTTELPVLTAALAFQNSIQADLRYSILGVV